MKPSVFLRIGALILAVFGLGHTYGHYATPSRGPAEAAVFESMQTYRFDIMGWQRSHWDFYRGLSFLLIINVAVLVVFVWHVASLANSDPDRARLLGIPLLVVLIALAASCWEYFFLAPAVMNTAAAVFVGLGLALLRGRRPPLPASSSRHRD